MTTEIFSEDFVRTLYREILNREGEQGSVVHFVHQLGDTPNLANAARLLSDFVNSPEAARKRQVAVLPRLTNTMFENVVSIGSNCVPSSLAKRYGLKRWSGPFDWIFSCPAMIADCLDNKFSVFLDQRHHVRVPDSEKEMLGANYCDHSVYKEKYGLRFIFNHYDISEPNVLEYYGRCVGRFLKALNDGSTLLMLGLFPNLNFSDFDVLCNAVERFPNAIILAIDLRQGSHEDFGVRVVTQRKKHRLVEIRSISGTNGVDFVNRTDERMFYELLNGVLQN